LHVACTHCSFILLSTKLSRHACSIFQYYKNNPSPTQNKGVARRKEIEGLRRSHSEKKGSNYKHEKNYFETMSQIFIFNKKKKAKKCMKL